MFDRAKQFVKDNEGPIAFGAGVFVGCCVVVAAPKFFIDPLALYNEDQPIPSLLLSEGFIKRNLGVSIIAADFLKDRGLIDEFIDFAGQMAQVSLDARSQI